MITYDTNSAWGKKKQRNKVADICTVKRKKSKKKRFRMARTRDRTWDLSHANFLELRL